MGGGAYFNYEEFLYSILTSSILAKLLTYRSTMMRVASSWIKQLQIRIRIRISIGVLGTFPQVYFQGRLPKVYFQFPKQQLPKGYVRLSKAQQSATGAERCVQNILGKLPLGSMHIWEVATWENTLGKLPLGKRPLKSSNISIRIKKSYIRIRIKMHPHIIKDQIHSACDFFWWYYMQNISFNNFALGLAIAIDSFYRNF